LSPEENVAAVRDFVERAWNAGIAIDVMRGDKRIDGWAQIGCSGWADPSKGACPPRCTMQ
jgi:hypothetical protein